MHTETNSAIYFLFPAKDDEVRLLDRYHAEDVPLGENA